MTAISSQRIKKIISDPPWGATLEIKGWLKSKRDAKDFSFLDVGDGSCIQGLQVIADSSLVNYQREIKKLTTGCSLRIVGVLQKSPAQGQNAELIAQEISVYGWADPDHYPLQKKKQSFEFLRSIPHLRGRTNSMGAMIRIRSRLSYAIHQFFQERGFHQLHTPIITTSDCEGAGEMFTLTALDLDQLVASPAKKVDYSADFFGQKASLTVSGQLEAETYAQALGNVYTFGPTFRAENSNTSRHLAEFWMVEPEMAFCDLEGDMNLAEEMLQFLIADLVNSCPDDLELFNRFVDKSLMTRLAKIKEAFTRLSYSEAIDHLLASKQAFEYPVSWGIDLQTEHEKYLTDSLFQRPVIVYNYPKNIKPFYMRDNDDGKTVAAMDVLIPGIGEIIGGSQREERLDILQQRMAECGVAEESYQWYLDLRRFGSVPHAGFGLGFERLVLFATGLSNIRDVIPFPRTPGSAAI
ncbi:MAG: asparagine--tRNA ligase [Proteobacteria bacterium]|nr:asparagine--tRNA ligase [Pseudomonadota bacterium]MBU1639986.1 asparagine--tRNA ligase [Pseudomonadota bacterium]